jgi:hypothetical protein
MRLISHRGNTMGPDPSRENNPQYIQAAIDKGYDVEVDARLLQGGIFLGHDRPDYQVDLPWLVARKDRLWIHTKNFQAIDFLIPHDLRVFYHQHERHVVIGNTRALWSCDLSEANGRSVVPMMGLEEIQRYKSLAPGFHGVCSDYVEELVAAL